MVVAEYVSTSDAALPKDLFTAKELDDKAVVFSIAQTWVRAFSEAVATADATFFDSLFCDFAYWRDLIAFTNDYRAIAKPNIFQAAIDRLGITKATNVSLVTDPAPSGVRAFSGHSFINAKFTFETALGPAFGLTRIVKTESGEYKAYVVLTCIDGVHGHPEHALENRLEGGHNSRIPYAEQRRRELDDPQPTVLIVGVGHNGIDTAARLKAYGIKCLIVDKNLRVGDNWRNRYASLTLHDSLWGANLPYMTFPTCYPKYLSAGMLADWLETYASALGLNVWLNSTVLKDETSYDATTKSWSVTVMRNGTTPYTFKVSHIVMATGLGGGKPKLPPPFPGQQKFKNTIIHSFGYKSGAPYEGKKALVVGTGSSGHDIAFDLYNNGANVTLLQRSPTFVMTLENGIETLNKGMYCDGGPPLQFADEMSETVPKVVAKTYFKTLIPMIASMDKDLLDRLGQVGFKTWLGPENSGFMYLSMEKNGGYYFDSGACEHIANGDIKVNGAEIDHFTEDSVVFKDGSVLEDPELVVLATGVTGFRESVAETLGEKAVKNLKQVWGLDEESELNSCFRDCGIPGVYFMVGALPLARFNSKIVAIQILAEQLGVFGQRYTIEVQKSNGISA
ncbi:hypothetical protein V1509DRAFT_630440 [Lipomyces kononenkoae]